MTCSLRRSRKKNDKIVGSKRKASKKEDTNSLSEKDSKSDLKYSDDEFDFSDLSGDESSTNNQLFKIEKKI